MDEASEPVAGAQHVGNHLVGHLETGIGPQDSPGQVVPIEGVVDGTLLVVGQQVHVEVLPRPRIHGPR